MEQSKFSGALANLKQSQAKDSADTPIEEPIGNRGQTIERGRGRPRAKSSDPAYQSTTLILRKTTKRKAARLLEDREMGKDLSELVEELLTEWLAQHAEM
jgi:hypothetical protein